MISPRTVDHHLRNVLAKLGITGGDSSREADLVGCRAGRAEYGETADASRAVAGEAGQVPTSLERALPDHHFRERHSRFIAADIDTVWTALATVRLDQLSVTRPLVAVRNLGRSAGSPARPLLSGGPVTVFELAAPGYAVGGAVGRPWQLRPQRRKAATMADFEAFDEPGWVKYLTDFRLTEEPGGTRLSTETRVRATDTRSRLLFLCYWGIIRPGSGLIRRDILATVDRLATGRTEGGTSHGGS